MVSGHRDYFHSLIYLKKKKKEKEATNELKNTTLSWANYVSLFYKQQLAVIRFWKYILYFVQNLIALSRFVFATSNCWKVKHWCHYQNITNGFSHHQTCRSPRGEGGGFGSRLTADRRLCNRWCSVLVYTEKYLLWSQKKRSEKPSAKIAGTGLVTWLKIQLRGWRAFISTGSGALSLVSRLLGLATWGLRTVWLWPTKHAHTLTCWPQPEGGDPWRTKWVELLADGPTPRRSVLCAWAFFFFTTLHERLQALCDVGLTQRHRSVGFRTLQGSLVLLAAHQAQHGSVQVLVLLLSGADEGLETLGCVSVCKQVSVCLYWPHR